MLQYYVRIAGIVLALALGGGAVAAAEPDGAELLERLQDWLDGTRDLSGRFEQTMQSGALGSGVRESGALYIKRPGRMRWDYLRPESKVAIVDDLRTWLYLEEDEQLMLGRLEEGTELLPRLLAGDQRIDELFEAVREEVQASKGPYRLRLVPKDSSDALEQVVLTLRRSSFAIQTAEVTDAAGNRVDYRFSGLKRNRGLRDDLFRLEPPVGTEILGEH